MRSSPGRLARHGAAVTGARDDLLPTSQGVINYRLFGAWTRWRLGVFRVRRPARPWRTGASSLWDHAQEQPLRLAAQAVNTAGEQVTLDEPCRLVSVETLEVVYGCCLCDDIPAVVVYVPPGAPDPQEYSADAPPGIEAIGLNQPRLSIRGGPAPVTITLGEDSARLVESALRTGSAEALYEADREYAPFWCRQCHAAYCRDHWRVVPVFDEDWFDYLRERARMATLASSRTSAACEC
jgi:hypothetical protein